MKPYDIAINMLMGCCALIHEEKNERLDEFMNFTINVANKAKETNGK